MIDLSQASDDNEKLALMILKAMEDGDLLGQIQDLCSDEFVWANSGLPTLNGKAEVFASMRSGGIAQQIPILKDMT